MKLRLLELAELRHVPARQLHSIDALVARMQRWPTELPAVSALPPLVLGPARSGARPGARTRKQAVALPPFLRSLGLPPILVCVAHGELRLIDGCHRLLAARAAGVRALYALEVEPPQYVRDRGQLN